MPPLHFIPSPEHVLMTFSTHFSRKHFISVCKCYVVKLATVREIQIFLGTKYVGFFILTESAGFRDCGKAWRHAFHLDASLCVGCPRIYMVKERLAHSASRLVFRTLQLKRKLLIKTIRTNKTPNVKDNNLRSVNIFQPAALVKRVKEAPYVIWRLY